MLITVNIEIAKPKATVWAAIIDIENSKNMISGIIAIEMLNKPKDTIVGLKWKETRKMFGKEATETMWITDFIENEFYCTRAENHGAVYITKLSLKETGENTLLTMTFGAEATSRIIKIISAIMTFFIKKSMAKELLKDLVDIKNHLEKAK